MGAMRANVAASLILSAACTSSDTFNPGTPCEEDCYADLSTETRSA